MTGQGRQAALAALRDRTRGASLEARLEAAAAALGGYEAELMATAAEELRRDRFVHGFALSRAQLELRLARESAGPSPERPRPGTRLTGPARAMGLMLARALAPQSRLARLRGDPNPAWDEAGYLAENPDLAGGEAGAGLAHYVMGGAEEGRPPPGLLARHGHVFEGMDGPPDSLGALAAATQPRFVGDCPDQLRDEALAVVRAAAPRISVILPTWNRAHVLPWALGSALLQSWPAHEVIVIDDGSDDGTAEMLEAGFADAISDGRLRVLRTAHAGVSGARNAGLAAATGEIVAYLDSDNVWEPDHLLFLGALLARDPGAELAYSAVGRHDLDGGWSDVFFAPWDRARLEETNYIDLNGVAHRRGAGTRIGGFDEGLRRLVDWDLILRLTQGTAPIAHPLVTAHHALSGDALGNITLTEDAETAQARIAAKRGGS